MSAETFEVHLEAEQVTETHRTLEADRSVTETELPGLFNVYLVINGGRILFDQIKAGRVFDAIDLAKQNAEPPPEEPAEPAPEQG